MQKNFWEKMRGYRIVKKVTETGHRIIDDHYFQEYIMVLLRSILFYIVTEHYYPNTQCIE